MVSFSHLVEVLDEDDELQDQETEPMKEIRYEKTDGSLAKFDSNLASCTSGAANEYEIWKENVKGWLSTAKATALVEADQNFGKPKNVAEVLVKPETFNSEEEQASGAQFEAQSSQTSEVLL